MPSILKSLDETQLRSLKFSEFTGREPFVLNSIDTKLESRVNLQQQVTKRVDDLVRITKLLTTRPGLKFIANTGLLAFSENMKKSEKLDLRTAGRAALQTGKTVASTLATILLQVPVNGTGVRFSADELAGTTYYRRKFFSFRGQSTTELRNPNGNFVKGELGQSKQLTKESKLVDIKSFEGFEQQFEKKPHLQRTQKQLQTIRQLVDIDTRSSGNIDAFLKMGGSQKTRSFRGTLNSTDQKNYLSVITELEDLQGNDVDIIPFKIQIITGTEGLENFFIYFRAYLESLSDNFSGKWNSTQYIGRGEPFYNYTGFDRNIGFSFKIAATSRAELIPLYQKLNYLVGSTAPTYGPGIPTDTGKGVSNTFMRANFIKLTIGDYLNEVPGFFESVDVSWDKSYPWEIKRGRPRDLTNDINDTETVKILPHILDVRVSFKPVHDFAPELQQTFIGNINVINPDKEIPSGPEEENLTNPDAVDLPSDLRDPTRREAREFRKLQKNFERARAKEERAKTKAAKELSKGLGSSVRSAFNRG